MRRFRAPCSLRRILPAALILASAASGGSAQDKAEQKPGPIIPIESDKLLGQSPGALKLTAERAAGLAEGVKPIVLTWDAAYRIALARHDRRTTAERLAILGDGAQLTDGEVVKLVAALKARPKADDDEAFRDPTASILEALRLFQEVECRFRLVGAAENSVLVSNFWRGDPGRREMGVERNNRMRFGITVARKDWLASQAAYRNALDDVKFELGLPLDTPLVADPSALDGLRRVFDGIDRWEARPGHEAEELEILFGRLPKTPELMIDGKSFMQESYFAAGHGAKLIESVAKSAEDERSALSLRKQMRRFLVVSTRFEFEKVDLDVATKDVDRRLRALLSPPPDGADAARAEADFSERLPAFLKSLGERQAAQEHLVASWAEAETLRHALERALGSLPMTRGEFLGRFDTWGGP